MYRIYLKNKSLADKKIQKPPKIVITADSSDQPGPSGIAHKFKKIDGDITQHELDQKEKKFNPLEHFAENVSIVGLRESYKEDFAAIRSMFIIALIAAICMIVYQAAAIVVQYRYQSTMYLDKDINDQAPFPSVTVCFPQVTNDIPLPDVSTLSERDVAFMIRNNLSMTDASKYVNLGFFLPDRKLTDSSTPLYVITKKLFDKMVQSFSTKQINLFKNILTLPCQNILSNCAFGDQQFDCCEEAQFQILSPFSCFEIRVNRNVTKHKRKDALQLEKIGLTFDVSKNWTNGAYENGTASDGFHIFIDSLPSMMAVPVHVPSGMNVLVSLGQTKLSSKTKKCFRPNQVPKLKYFDVYDPFGFYCCGEALLDNFQNTLGCLVHIYDFFPTNQTCSFAQFFTLGLGLAGTDVDGSGDGHSEALKKQAEKGMKAYTLLFSDQSPCKPLCTLWIHPVLSASYGSIQYRDKEEEQRQLVNRSWSRIRVILPDQSYISRQEIEVDAKYLVMCKIGSVMSAYAGFSVITFAEILFYGAYIIWLRKKKIRIRPERRISPTSATNSLNVTTSKF